MKIQKKLIAIPVSGYDGIHSKVSGHFGKSRGFIITDEAGGELTYLDTAKVRGASECAPITALVRAGARVVVAKSMGRGALRRCHEAGMQILEANGATVKEVLDLYQSGQTADFPDTALCAHHSHGSVGEDECHTNKASAC
jgi:predicted Fe-Mo cluster-binding NifX family protein